MENRLEGDPQAELLRRLIGDARDLCALSLGLEASIGDGFMVIYEPKSGDKRDWRCALEDTRFTILMPGDNGLKPLLSIDIANFYAQQPDEASPARQYIEVIARYRPTTWKMRWAWVRYVRRCLKGNEASRARWNYTWQELVHIMFLAPVVLTALKIAIERECGNLAEAPVQFYGDQPLTNN
jgi:hypothetical protein